jgi:hypothetical protein
MPDDDANATATSAPSNNTVSSTTTFTNNTVNSTVTERVRRGITFDKWPFRLDIDTEFQDWIVVCMVFLILFLWCMPCLCGRMRNRCARHFTEKVYTRLHVFFCLISYINLAIVMFVIGVCPDWTVNEFLLYLGRCITWFLVHMQKMITSLGILAAFYLMIRFRDRIALAAGMEHATVVRFDWRQYLGFFKGKKRPIEVFLWKVEDLQSSASKILKSNDIFVECHLGHNEPMRTRVHNNAGHSCIIKESLQMNVDESASGEMMTLFVRDQTLMTSTELGRIMLSTREILGIEDQTGKRRIDFEYNEDAFVSLNLNPRGKVWIAIAPVEDGDEERAPLMDDSLVTC